MVEISNSEIWNNSQLLDIRSTKYGGRGYFAKGDITAGTTVLICKAPFINIIFKDFKKEVCGYCFSYDEGRTRKFRLSKSVVGGSAYGGLYFCSDQCRKDWENQHDKDGLLSLSLESIEKGMKQKKKREPNPDSEFPHFDNADQTDQDLIWKHHEMQVKEAKNKKQLFLPELDDGEYDFARLVAACAVEKARNNWIVFDSLQSNEYLQLQTFPGLLQSQLKIYRFLSLVLPEIILRNFNSDVLRKTFGKEAGNAFGIWELPSRDSECFGSAIYPTGAFFDHRCDPNVSKSRVGSAMHFIANRDIVCGSELCIAYGMLEETDFQTRNRILQQQWHFKCDCSKCKNGI